MNVVKQAQEYILKMIGSVSGMKVLLMDAETIAMVSLVCAQSDIMEKEVFLFERLDNASREVLLHLNAVVLVRPTLANVGLLSTELRDPKYGEYHLFFTNVIRSSELEDIAMADGLFPLCLSPTSLSISLVEGDVNRMFHMSVFSDSLIITLLWLIISPFFSLPLLSSYLPRKRWMECVVPVFCFEWTCCLTLTRLPLPHALACSSPSPLRGIHACMCCLCVNGELRQNMRW